MPACDCILAPRRVPCSACPLGRLLAQCASHSRPWCDSSAAVRRSDRLDFAPPIAVAGLAKCRVRPSARMVRSLSLARLTRQVAGQGGDGIGAAGRQQGLVLRHARRQGERLPRRRRLRGVRASLPRSGRVHGPRNPRRRSRARSLLCVVCSIDTADGQRPSRYTRRRSSASSPTRTPTRRAACTTSARPTARSSCVTRPTERLAARTTRKTGQQRRRPMRWTTSADGIAITVRLVCGQPV